MSHGELGGRVSLSLSLSLSLSISLSVSLSLLLPLGLKLSLSLFFLSVLCIVLTFPGSVSIFLRSFFALALHQKGKNMKEGEWQRGERKDRRRVNRRTLPPNLAATSPLLLFLPTQLVLVYHL